MSPGPAARHMPRRAAALVLACTTLAMAACDGPASPEPPQLHVTAGDGQAAPIGTWLPEPIVVTATDGAGAPLADVEVTWRPPEDGRLVPLDATTDSNGHARAAWLLGDAAGVRTAGAMLAGSDPVTFTATGVADPDGLPVGELRGLDFATYDGSNQVVHPDYAATPTDAFGPRRHLAITPYPFGNARFENPSLFDGVRPDAWQHAPEVPNPIVLPDQGYLSDPDLVYVPEADELWLYYRQVTSDNIIQLVRTRDERTWSTPVEVVRAPNHQIVSPSVVRRAANDWWMFAVNSGAVGCSAASTTVEVRRSSDGIHWGTPTAAAALAQPDLWPWHIDVQWIPSRNEFWALYNAKAPGGCTTPALFIASSSDGMTWHAVSTPVLSKGQTPAFQDIVYRSTFDYDPASDVLTLWYSGARFDAGRYVWSAAVERRRRTELFAEESAVEAYRLFAPAPAPLLDWP